MRGLLVLAPFAMGLVLTGCGGDGGGGLDTGIEGDRQLDDLSDEEAQQACRELESYLLTSIDPDEIQRATCTATGIASENTVPGTTCEAVVDDCTAEPADPLDLDFDCDSATADPLSTCQATVAELEACITEMTGNLDATFSELTCDIADDPDWSTQLEEITADLQSPSCEQLEDDCPFADFGIAP